MRRGTDNLAQALRYDLFTIVIVEPESGSRLRTSPLSQEPEAFVRHALALAAASCLLITPIARATETVAPTMSEELLQLWNNDYSTPEYTLDPEAVSIAEQEVEVQVGERFDRDVEAMDNAPRSMTPNLDRLFQRDHSGFPSTATSRIPSAGTTYSKNGSGSTRILDRNPKPPTPPKPPKGDDDCDPPTPTPEPASMLLFGAAAATAAGIKARRRKKDAAKSL